MGGWTTRMHIQRQINDFLPGLFVVGGKKEDFEEIRIRLYRILDDFDCGKRSPDWQPTKDGRSAVLLQAVDLAVTLGNFERSKGHVSWAIDAYSVAFRVLEHLGCGPEPVNQRMEKVAESLSRLFERDPNVEAAWWGRWVAEADRGIYTAILVYACLLDWDVKKYLSKMAFAKMDVANKLVALSRIDYLELAADYAAMASDDYRALIENGASDYRIHLAESSRLACALYYELGYYESAQWAPR